MRLLAVLFLAFSIAAPGTADAASYYLNRYEDQEITRYSNPDWQSHNRYSSHLEVSPYRAVTHGLHPYYRNTYYTRTAPKEKITRPEFYRYLEDLYYSGSLGTQLQREVPISLRCPNYSVRRTSARMPRQFLGCN